MSAVYRVSSEDIIKIAFFPSAAQTALKLKGVLGTQLPKLFSSVRSGAGALGITAQNAPKLKPMMAAGGALIGGVRGASNAEPGQETGGAIRGALMGGALGYGAGWAGSKLPTLGTKYVKDIKPLTKRLGVLGKNENLTYKRLGTTLADESAKWTGAWEHIPARAKSTPTATPKLLGIHVGSERKATDVLKGQARSKPLRAIGELGRGVSNMIHKGPIQGFKHTIKTDWKSHQFFTEEKAGKTFRFKRTPFGRVAMPLLASGVGMGAADALMTSNEDGSKPSVGQRLRRGAVSTVSWGMAPRLMLGKAFGYDVPKAFIGGNETPQQDLNY